MASIHDPLLHLLRDDPTPLLTLLRAMLPPDPPQGPLPLHGWRASSEAFGRARFRERRPDLVLVHPEFPLVLILELQNRRDHRKLRTWPYYTATASLRHDRDALLVVFTLRRSVAAWARSLRSPPWCVLRPVVIGPDELLAEPSSPAMAVLTALAAGDRQHVARALSLIADLDDESKIAYLDLLRDHLSGRSVAALLEAVMVHKRRRYPGYEKLVEEVSRMWGREEGKIEGKIEGRIEATEALRSAAAQMLRRVGRDAEIAALEVMDLPMLEQRFRQLVDELVLVGG